MDGWIRTTSFGRVLVVENALYSQIIESERYSLGSLFRFMRERQGLSSRALAERVGCSSSYVSKLETQGMVPAANVFARLVNVLECSDAEIQFLLILLEKM